MAGERGQGQICLNGPPARHFQRGDKVIILAEAWVTPEEFDSLDPVVVIVEDDQNRQTRTIRHRGITPGQTGADAGTGGDS